MAAPTLITARDALVSWIRRFIASQQIVTYLGPNSVAYGLGKATAELLAEGASLAAGIMARFTLLGTTDTYVEDVARERGAGDRLGATRSKVYVVLNPASATVTAITNAGASDLIEVDDSTYFPVGAALRIRSANASVTETAVVIAVTTGSGPNGGDELEVLALAGTYSPGTETVRLILRVTVPADTVFTSTTGLAFQSLEAVVTGDANPIMDGESTTLALADKVWCECTTAGVAGNIERGTITALQTPIDGLLTVSNPQRADGGADVETTFALKYRAAHGNGGYTQETADWAETLARTANSDVLRAIITSTRSVGSMTIALVKRNGGVFSSNELSAIATYMSARSRSGLAVTARNATLTSVEVESVITLRSGYTIEDAWKAAADDLAVFLDYRKWPVGQDVDEADLLAIVKRSAGVATLETATFLPSTTVDVGAESLPVLARLSLYDSVSGLSVNADLAVGF